MSIPLLCFLWYLAIVHALATIGELKKNEALGVLIGVLSVLAPLFFICRGY
jgi:hypothetical protein